MTTTLLRTSLLKRVLTRSSDFLLYSNPGRPRLGAHIRNCQVTSFDKLTVDSDDVNRLDRLKVGVPVPRTKSDLHQPVEKIYQRKSQVEHILLRPDSYIGSVQTVSEPMWVHDGANMVQREITFVPGLFKIFDEILVNAADNKQRDPSMDTIKVDINAETNTISVYNNGSGIPVVHHKEENMYVPTMIFGHLLTSSNFSDEDLKTTGGRNGFGAKLCNVFSSKFTLETADRNKSFKQTWTNNMSKVSEPIVKDSNKEFTKITFRPDLKKFNMKELDEDTVAMFSRRAYDIAASSKGVKVYLNGKRLPVKDFKSYVDQYLKGKEDETGGQIKCVFESVDRWDVAVAVSDKGFQQMSFVNSIATTKGGRHVDYVTDMLVKNIIETVKKKQGKGGMIIKPFQVKNHLWVFVNCLIVNPTFDSQTKENMTLVPRQFGSQLILSEKFNKEIVKSGIVEAVLAWSKFKADMQLKTKQGGKKTEKLKGIPKLEVSGNLETKYKCSEYGVTVTEKWTTDNQLATTIDLQDKVMKGLKLTFDSSFSPDTGAKTGKIKADLKHDVAALSADCDINMAGPLINAAAVIGHKGWLAGYQMAFDSAKSKLTKNNLSVGYTTGDFVLHTNVNDGAVFGGSIYHKVNPQMETGVNLGWTASSNTTTFGIGGKYVLDKDASIRAKINNSSQIGLGYQQKLRDGLTITLSTLVDGKNFNQGGHKIGLVIEMES